jgi:hypothetical protein
MKRRIFLSSAAGAAMAAGPVRAGIIGSGGRGRLLEGVESPANTGVAGSGAQRPQEITPRYREFGHKHIHAYTFRLSSRPARQCGDSARPTAPWLYRS